MTEPIVDRVLRSARYRDVDRCAPRPAGRGRAAEVPERRRCRQAREAAPAPGGRRLSRCAGTGSAGAGPRNLGRESRGPGIPHGLRRCHAQPRVHRRAAAAPRAVLRADLGPDGRPAANAARPRLWARSAGPALDGPVAGSRVPRLRYRSPVAGGGAHSSIWSDSRTSFMRATSSLPTRRRFGPTWRCS